MHDKSAHFGINIYLKVNSLFDMKSPNFLGNKVTR